ncbi:DUF4097 family beta strand repeat-containing protein [Streptomyces pinistramenti]|uniref:DUF4097 family beta strand repeat-containing protein n=1 Tax=Streptomyces pinistramenti TaxID=2884812 RepID=UPI001D0871D7|nr:DUF4097 family beta strand repeat-containing protein [Streptomyces pinistramenti]MCB5907023.1 DUF4097 domain-containing protein [Streptomyces pinistramenti]
MAHLRMSHLALSCAALAVLTAGCSMDTLGPSKKAERTYTVDGEVTSVAADTAGGTIEIVPLDEGGQVKVTEKYEYTGSKPHPTHTVKDGRLGLTAKVCKGMGARCTVNYKVLVPRKAAVDLRTSGGDIKVSGTSGAIDAETSGGDVTLAGCASRKAKVKTSGGTVDAAFTAVPDDVSAGSSGGDVTVRLPKGTYAVDATTSGGDRKVSVTTNESAAHKVAAHTSGGNVSVVPAS